MYYCETFEYEYTVIFNAKQKVCCQFGDKTSADNYKVYFNGATLKWKNCVRRFDISLTGILMMKKMSCMRKAYSVNMTSILDSLEAQFRSS